MRRIKSNERKDLGHVTVFITDQDKEKTVLVFEKGRKDSKLKFPGGGIEEGE